MNYFIFDDPSLNLKYGANKSDTVFEFYEKDIFAFLGKNPKYIRRVSPASELIELTAEDYDDIYMYYQCKTIMVGKKHLFNFETIKELIDEGADYRICNDQLLHWAVANRHFNIFKYVIDKIDNHPEQLIESLKKTGFNRPRIIKYLNRVKKNNNSKNQLICDHCKYPILKNGVHVTTNWFDNVKDRDSNYFLEEEYYHQKCLIQAIELKTVKKAINSIKKDQV